MARLTLTYGIRSRVGVNSPLTEEGINLAKEMGRYFNENNIHFDKAYASTAL